MTTEIVGDSHGSDVHLALQANLRIGQMLGMPGTGQESHSLPLHPLPHGVRLVVADLH